VNALERFGRLLGRTALAFLEMIGLRAPRTIVSHQAQLEHFRRNYAAFRRLLTANDNFLHSMVELDQKLVAEDAGDGTYARQAATRMVANIHQMIASLNEIGAGRHEDLWGPFESVKSALGGMANGAGPEAEAKLVYDLSSVDGQLAGSVGSKMANLGEIRNRLQLPTPDGFAMSVQAYRLLINSSRIKQLVQNVHASLLAEQGPEGASARLVESFRRAEVPVDVRREILDAFDRLAERTEKPCRVAVRSSALGEDTSLSYAGQYETVLNVDREGLLVAWLQVVASLYSPAAIHYRLLHGLPGPQAAMAVGFVHMIPATASGVVLSRDPTRPDRDHVVVQIVAGLGLHLVDGSTNPETVEVTLSGEGAEIRRVASRQEEQLVCDEQGGIAARAVPADSPDGTLLTDGEAEQLARWARLLEAHFGSPQDMEWAMDRERRLFILQSRPLRIAHTMAEAHLPVPGARLLVDVGEIVCPGVATGVAVHLAENGDFSRFPEGGVLVAKRSSPRFVALMGKAAAIVTDAGSTTGHMASLAREFRIPTLLGTREGTRLIGDGQVVTVDAFRGFVYADVVEVPAKPGSSATGRSSVGRNPEALRLLERTAELVVPLNLVDPHAPEFRAAGCRTLHDMARFVHEKSYEEMFRMGESLGDFRSAAYYLDIFLPVDLYIIDLGGGISGAAQGNRIKTGQISSVPLAALVKGMLHPKIPRWGARPIDLGGFMSVIMRHALTSPEQERSFRDPCYALASDRYVNCTARVGYHFSIVDAYCGETTNKNYVHLLFRGGAADLARRSRRARAIAGILKEWGFAVETLDDSTQGRITKMPREETARLIEYIGRLLQFMRQMDVAMTSEEAVLEVQQAFLREDYALDGSRGVTRPAMDAPKDK
jgi:pyruvate, water dikinase